MPRLQLSEVGPWRTSNDEIASLCRYITDDQVIADYYAIDVQRVRQVRRDMPRERQRQDLAWNGSVDNERQTRTATALSSSALYNACLDEFDRVADRLGVSVVEAERLCGMRADAS